VTPGQTLRGMFRPVDKPGATRDGPLSAAPGVPVEVVDSTGAGDAFAAAALHAWLDGADVPTALRAAVHAGARAVTHLGGRPTLL